MLSNRVRASDVLGRLGGDEFAVLLPHADQAEAAAVAGALVAAIREGATLFLGGELRVTTSLGVAMFDLPEQLLSAEAMLSEADAAMYAAKQAGGNRYAFGTSSPLGSEA